MPGYGTSARALRYLHADVALCGYVAVPAPDAAGGPDAALRLLLADGCDVAFLYDSTVEDRQGCAMAGCDPALWAGLGKDYVWIKNGIREYVAGGLTPLMARKDAYVVDLLSTAVESVVRESRYRQLCCDFRDRGVVFGESSRRFAVPCVGLGTEFTCSEFPEYDDALCEKHGHCASANGGTWVRSSSRPLRASLALLGVLLCAT